MNIEIENKFDNEYYKDNPKFFDELVDLVRSSRNFFIKLKAKAGTENYQNYHHLKEWIDSELPLLVDEKFEYSCATKCYWIFNNMQDFPICPVCHKNDNFRRKNITLTKGYLNCCSRECNLHDPARAEKIKSTLHANSERDHDFWNKRYEKTKTTCQQRYGVDNPSQLEEIKLKKELAFLDHYGVTCNLVAPEIRKDIEATWLEKYGVRHISQSDYYKKTFRETSIREYGCEHPMQNSEVRKRNRKRYIFNGIIFDSSWEIALYIYLTDHRISFVYQPDDKIFQYVVRGKTKRYFPDFKIGNEYVEIKGDHMIDKKTGHWIPPPYMQKMCNEDEYKYECEVAEAKFQCALSNGIKTLTYEDCKRYLDYIDSTYGKNYIHQFKNE